MLYLGSYWAICWAAVTVAVAALAAEDLEVVASVEAALVALVVEVVAEAAPAADGNLYKFILGKNLFRLNAVPGKIQIILFC
jgi:hypothetical protein